jgi:solute carrier family 25 (mitochondrial citrate transporter), member 1
MYLEIYANQSPHLDNMAAVTTSITPVSIVQAPKAPATQQKAKISPALSLFAGATAGAIEAAITYPFEFTKTRAQLPDPSTGKRPGMVSILSRVVREEGFRSIYTGCNALIIGTAFKASVRFLTYDSIKNVLASENGSLSPMRGMVAGMAAGAVESVVAVTPTERIKTALIDDARGQRRFRGGLHATRTLIAENGISALYRGLVATTIKQSATSATRMGTYNVLKETSKAWDLKSGPVLTFANGAIAGTVAVYVSQPFDTVKTRAQSAKGSTIPEAIKGVLTERGPLGFWSGSTMRLGRLVLSGGIVFSVYEAVVGLLQ